MIYRSACRYLLALAAGVAALFMFFAVADLAGDRAELNILGYSPNFRYFAFEEFGVFDGSGGNYSHIFIVDLKDDSWVKGTPFSTETTDDGDANPVPLDAVRAKTMALAAPVLKQLGVSEPASTLVLLGDGVPDADGKTMSAAYPSCCGPNDTDPSGSLTLTLSTFPAKMSGACQVDGALGFALTARYSDGSTDEIHRDGGTLPKSRSCPQDYRLYAIVAPFEQFGPRIALISSYPFDFEGTSRRYLAVPIDGWQDPEDSE